MIAPRSIAITVARSRPSRPADHGRRCRCRPSRSPRRSSAYVVRVLPSTWTYDAATNGLGLLYQATTNLGYVRTQAYDSYSRAASTALTPDTSGFFFTKSYTYDPTTGRLATETNPDGAVLSTVYNAAGYPSGRTMTVAGTTTNVSTITGVDDSNRPLTVVSGGVPGSSTSYDSLTTRTFDAECGFRRKPST